VGLAEESSSKLQSATLIKHFDNRLEGFNKDLQRRLGKECAALVPTKFK
jgi:hypothetical protein